MKKTLTVVMLKSTKEQIDFKDQESDSDTTCEPSSCDGQTSSDENIDCSHVESDKRERRVVKWQGCITSCERNENGHKPNNEGFHSTGKTAEFAQDNVDVILRDTIIIQRGSGAYLLVPKPKDGVKLKIISIKVGETKTDVICDQFLAESLNRTEIQIFKYNAEDTEDFKNIKRTNQYLKEMQNLDLQQLIKRNLKLIDLSDKWSYKKLGRNISGVSPRTH